jgi:hypothetical protein
MAIRGRKPIPRALRLITGSHLRDRPLPQQRGEAMPGGPIERPKKISRPAAALWDEWIARASWLTWADGPKAFMWCNLQAEFLKSAGTMSASRIAQLRGLGSELGLDHSRLGHR